MDALEKYFDNMNCYIFFFPWKPWKIIEKDTETLFILLLTSEDVVHGGRDDQRTRVFIIDQKKKKY